MTQRTKNVILAIVTIMAVVIPLVNPQRETADALIAKDRTFRQSSLKSGKNVAATPKWGFFGTVFHLILEQINDTKSAYNQISDLVNDQFLEETPNSVTMKPPNGTEPTKITRAEFLRILDRNLKGLNRLRNLEWREARKDSRSNLQGYWNELFKNKRSSR